MKTTTLQQTLFEIEKLRNVVNVAGCTVLQIYTSPGKLLGDIGIIAHPNMRSAANEENFLAENRANAFIHASNSWFRKAMTALTR